MYNMSVFVPLCRVLGYQYPVAVALTSPIGIAVVSRESNSCSPQPIGDCDIWFHFVGHKHILPFLSEEYDRYSLGREQA